MKYTENYNLYKPDYDDTIDVNFLNQNMDVLDGTVAGLNYVQNVNTSDKGLTFIKRDGQQIDVPLNYLKLTGGTVKGDTEFTGKLTNNGKIVGQLFNGAGTIESILDWDKMKEVYGSTMTSATTIIKGKSQTITFPNWCILNTTLGVAEYLATNKDIYLTRDFTDYDEIVFLTVQSSYFAKITRHKTAQLDYFFENFGLVNLTDTSGDLVVYGYNQYGTNTTASNVSTKRMFKYYDDSCYIVDVFGIKYTEVK